MIFGDDDPDDVAEYTVRIEDDGGKRCLAHYLRQKAERSSRAKRLEPDSVDVSGPNDDVAQFLELVLQGYLPNRSGP